MAVGMSAPPWIYNFELCPNLHSKEKVQHSRTKGTLLTDGYGSMHANKRMYAGASSWNAGPFFSLSAPRKTKLVDYSFAPHKFF